MNKSLTVLVKRSRLLLIVPVLSLCTSGCATPLIALGASAANAGMQALGGAGVEALGGAAGTAGMELIGDKAGDTLQNFMPGGEPVADMTYWTSPALLANIVDRTLRHTASSSITVLQYSKSDQESEDLFVLSTPTGSELRIAVMEDASFDNPRATQMVVDMEAADAASRNSEIAAFIDALEEIDSKTLRQDIEKIRGEFDYASAFNA